MSDNFHLQLYRGTTAQNDAYTGPAGELTVDTTLSKLRLHDGSTAGGTVIGSMPTGSIIPYAGSTAPDGYLLCDGSAISRTTYSALFAIIGTTYGEGDGNSTFNLPINQRYLIEKKEPTDSDYTWYNLYSDGWCEQGGQVNNSSAGQDVTFLKTYLNTYYTITQSILCGSRQLSNNCYSGLIYKTTTGFTIGVMGQATDKIGTSWQACGYTSTNIGKTIIKY